MPNHIVNEMIKKAKEASIKNRGAYPVTSAKHVFFQDGVSAESNDYVIPDLMVNLDLVEDPSTIGTVIADLEEGAIVEFSSGTIDTELTLEKSVTITGENVGVAQNFAQEV